MARTNTTTHVRVTVTWCRSSCARKHITLLEKKWPTTNKNDFAVVFRPYTHRHTLSLQHAVRALCAAVVAGGELRTIRPWLIHCSIFDSKSERFYLYTFIPGSRLPPSLIIFGRFGIPVRSIRNGLKRTKIDSL